MKHLTTKTVLRWDNMRCHRREVKEKPEEMIFLCNWTFHPLSVLRASFDMTSFDMLCKRLKDCVTVKPAIYPDIRGTNEGWNTALDFRKYNLATEISRWNPITAFLKISSVSWLNVSFLFDVCSLKRFNVAKAFFFLLFYIGFLSSNSKGITSKGNQGAFLQIRGYSPVSAFEK